MTGEELMVQTTETDQLRRQLLQAQRLSSVGALASSVAHEFNNILTTIINYAKMGIKAEGDDAVRTQALEKILKGSQRAATVINSMLGFARNNTTHREMTDVVGLVEKVSAVVDKAEAERIEKKMRAGKTMDLADFLVALKQMQAMGPLKQLAALLPGVNAKAVQALPSDDKKLKHIEAIVLSMTPDERRNPSILGGPRKLRIAKGSGRTVQEVNRLLEQFEMMRKFMKGK